MYFLEPLLVGKFPSFPLSKFLYGYQGDERVAAPCIAWLATDTSSNQKVLVDTGPGIPTSETKKFHQDLDVKEENRIDIVLKKHGVDPSEITHVVFTHLHFDHCAYADFLPNAKIIVQKSELQYAVAPNVEHRTGYETGYNKVIPKWMPAFDKISAISGDQEISPGFRILSLPGHTPGSAGAVFDTSGGRYAIVGDLVNQTENWEGNNGKHIAPTLNIGLDECMKSFKRLEKEADYVLASHDYRMFDNAKYG